MQKRMTRPVRHLLFPEALQPQAARRAGVLKFRQRVLKLLQRAFHVRRAVFAPGGSGHARGAVIRQPGQHGETRRDIAHVASEKSTPFVIEHTRDAIGKMADLRAGIGALRRAGGVDMEHPAGAEVLDGGAHLHGHPLQLRGHGACGVLPAHLKTGEEGSVLLQDDARRNQRGIGQQIGQSLGAGTEIVKPEHVISRCG